MGCTASWCYETEILFLKKWDDFTNMFAHWWMYVWVKISCLMTRSHPSTNDLCPECSSLLDTKLCLFFWRIHKCEHCVSENIFTLQICSFHVVQNCNHIPVLVKLSREDLRYYFLSDNILSVALNKNKAQKLMQPRMQVSHPKHQN